MKKSIYILLCILLSACAATTPAPSATPKVMDTVAPKTSSTPTVAVTATVQPSSTPTLPAPTEEVFQQDLTQQAYDAQATKERPTRVARATKIAAEFGVVCYGSEQTEYTSPNGNWVATFCGDKQNAVLEIVSRESKRWVLQLKDFIPEDRPPGGFRPEHWSNDGEYLYFSLSLGISGGASYACFYGFGAQGVYRIRLNDGIVSPILPAWKDFAFSPTGRRLAYGLGDLIIRDLQTGEETSITAGGVFGPFVWSPDGLELAYATCKDDNSDSIKKSAVKIFSIQQNASRTILEMEKKFLTIESWNANNIITVYSRDEQYLGDDLFFDLNSSQWITPTPTP